MGLIVRVVGQCAQPDPPRSQPRPSATATPTRRSGRGHSVNLGFLHIPARTPYNSHLSIFIVECLGRFHSQWMTSMAELERQKGIRFPAFYVYRCQQVTLALWGSSAIHCLARVWLQRWARPGSAQSSVIF